MGKRPDQFDGLTVIYRILHVASGRCYIGHSTNWRARQKGHLRLLSAGTHHSPYLQHAWSKYGPSAFAFDVIEVCEDSEKLVREQFWIDNSASVFNFARVAGSRKGVPQSAEANDKVRRAHLGRKRSHEQRAAMSRAAMGNQKTKGLKWSDEARSNMSRAVKGKPRSPAQIEATRRSLELARQKSRVNKPGMNWRVLRNPEAAQ